MSAYQKLTEAAEYLKTYIPGPVRTGVVLGSGLGDFIKEMAIEQEIAYDSIPHFPVVTVEGHQGKLIVGTIQGKRLIALSGRFHYYEGYTPEEVVFPVRVMKLLGVETLLVSNAAGGVNPTFKVGSLMIITDHISFSIINPLLGRNEDRLGPRFPDMSEPYKKYLIVKAKEVARQLNIEVEEGVYYGVTGPTFETRAEYKMIHLLGGDAVGMSTVQEVIAANHAGMNVFAMSVITDIGIREEENTITHEEVLQAAKNAGATFSALFSALVTAID